MVREICIFIMDFEFTKGKKSIYFLIYYINNIKYVQLPLSYFYGKNTKTNLSLHFLTVRYLPYTLYVIIFDILYKTSLLSFELRRNFLKVVHHFSI